MMKKISLLIALASGSLMVFPACDGGGDGAASAAPSDSGSPPEGTPSATRIDPELQGYVDTFINEANSRGVVLNSERMRNLTLRFGVLEGGTLGTCSTLGSEQVDIVINVNLRGSNPEFTVIHELGHCILRMLHRDDTISIMNTFSTDRRLELMPRSAVFDEFFQSRFFEAF